MVLQDSFARLQCETINTNNQLGVTTMIALYLVTTVLVGLCVPVMVYHLLK